MERSAGSTEESRDEAPEDRAEGEEAAKQDENKPRFPWEEEPEDDGEPGVVKRNLEELREEAAEDARNLHEGRAVGMFGTRLPLRLLGAISVFVGAFVVVYLLTWAALGDIGLLVGFFIAAIVGVIAVKVFASLGSGSASSAG